MIAHTGHQGVKDLLAMYVPNEVVVSAVLPHVLLPKEMDLQMATLSATVIVIVILTLTVTMKNAKRRKCSEESLLPRDLRQWPRYMPRTM
jgi:hypothetical protein